MSIDRIWELLTKKFNNEISSQELDELEELLHNNRDAFQLNELLDGLEELPLKPLTDDAMKLRSMHAIKAATGMEEEQGDDESQFNDDAENVMERKRKRRIPVGISVLVTVLLSVAAAWFLIGEKNKENKELANVNEIKTDAGSKTTVNLPDGSVVVLNAGSKLSYNKEFGISSRKITLTGEAYFDIRKNPEMPLVVHAGTVDIWVKGTTFNVKAYPKDSTIETSLLTGIIELVSQKDPERKILLRPNEKIVISRATGDKQLSTSDSKIDLNNGESVTLSRMRPDPGDSSYAEIAWLQNKMVFRSESFASLARSMERRYNITIRFQDTEVSELIFTGSFTEETLTEALEALKITVPFHYSIEGKTVLISK